MRRSVFITGVTVRPGRMRSTWGKMGPIALAEPRPRREARLLLKISRMPTLGPRHDPVRAKSMGKNPWACNLVLAARHRVGHIEPHRRCGRVAEGGGLLNRYRVVKPYRGFESLRLRQPSPRLTSKRLRLACTSEPAEALAKAARRSRRRRRAIGIAAVFDVYPRSRGRVRIPTGLFASRSDLPSNSRELDNRHAGYSLP
jgi:hypothetical protein